MANMKRIIEAHCKKTGEKVVAFVLGQPFPNKVFGAEDLAILDYELEMGYGVSDENGALYLWTDKSVVILTEYDGQAKMKVVPRDPVAVIPVSHNTYERLDEELEDYLDG